MTIEETIEHCKEIVTENRRRALEFARANVYDAARHCQECATEHEQLAAWLVELKESRECTRWIPCSERLPENDAKCLVYTSDKRVCMARWYGKYDEQGAWYIISDAVPKLYRIKNVPFWMPMPEPPKK